MVWLELRKSQLIVSLQKPPLILRIFLMSVAIFIVMMAMAAVEQRNEQFEGLANPSLSSPDETWYLAD